MSQLINEESSIISNEQVGPNLYLMRLSSPKIASVIEPGQFVHMRIPGMKEHILRRPFSIYAYDAEEGWLDILYQTVGYGSTHMTTLTPDSVLYVGPVELIGPVGTVWEPARLGCDTHKRILLVGGGAGAPPLYMLAKEAQEAGVEVDVVLGAATKDALVCRERFEELLGKNPACATDDGSYGTRGFATILVKEALESHSYDYVATCGPTPLMKIVSEMALEDGVFCEVSTERRMACGVGACLSCVVETTEGKKRSCVDGPIFNAEKVVW